MPQHELNEWNLKKTHVQKITVDRKIDIVTSDITRLFREGGGPENSGQASYCRYVVHAVAPIWVGFP